jgi:hypothetical protein
MTTYKQAAPGAACTVAPNLFPHLQGVFIAGRDNAVDAGIAEMPIEADTRT